METVGILGIDIATVTGDGLRERLVSFLKSDQTQVVGKVPAEFVVRSLRDPGFRAYLQGCDLNVADGVGVLWAARFLTLRSTKVPVLKHIQVLWQAAYTLASVVLRPSFCRYPIPEQLRGLQAFHVMLAAAEEAGAPVYFLGAKADVNREARAELARQFPKLTISGGHDGYALDDTVTREIDRSGASLLIVAMGSPRQEYWIRDHLPQLKQVRVAVGEGGTLDLIAGDYRLTPTWMQRVGLEWLWRLFMHRDNKSGGDSRARRVWNAVPVFICHTVRWKLAHGPAATTERPPADGPASAKGRRSSEGRAPTKGRAGR